MSLNRVYDTLLERSHLMEKHDTKFKAIGRFYKGLSCSKVAKMTISLYIADRPNNFNFDQIFLQYLISHIFSHKSIGCHNFIFEL